jgi:uncharacterized protein with GYD domain
MQILKTKGRRSKMAIFVMLSNLTDDGRKTIKKNPDRIKEVNKEVEAMGAKVVAQYALLGPYDFVNILDAPNSEVVSRVAIELGSRGTVQTMTMAALTIDEFVNSLKK